MQEYLPKPKPQLFLGKVFYPLSWDFRKFYNFAESFIGFLKIPLERKQGGGGDSCLGA